MLHATWYEGTTQLLSLPELKSHLFEFYFIGWTIKPMKEGRKPECPEKTRGDELQKMPHTTARWFKPQARLKPAQQHSWQARKADMLSVTPCVASKVSQCQSSFPPCCTPTLPFFHPTSTYSRLLYPVMLFTTCWAYILCVLISSVIPVKMLFFSSQQYKCIFLQLKQ